MSILQKRRERRRMLKGTKVKEYSSIGELIARLSGGLLFFVYCCSLVFPVLWLIYSSFKTDIDYINHIWALPSNWMASNYAGVIDKLTIVKTTVEGEYYFTLGMMLWTSFYTAILPTAIGLFANVVFAYVLSKFEFPGRMFIYNLGIILFITPIYGTGPAGLNLSKALNLYDNMLPNILLGYQGGFIGTNFLILYAAFKGISWTYAEAAQIDGASHFMIFFRIMFPMIAPTYICLVAMGFLGAWNSYEQFLLYYPSYANLAYGVYHFQAYAQYYNATGTEVLAGFVICMIPSIIVYLLADRFVLQKFTIGGLKA